MEKETQERPVEANSTGGQGSRRAVEPNDDRSYLIICQVLCRILYLMSASILCRRCHYTEWEYTYYKEKHRSFSVR
jgi:hypothetical protein